MEFAFSRPDNRPELSEQANAAIAFAALNGRLSTELRTRVYTPDGRRENVAGHSHMVAVVASELAAQYFPELDADRIARLGNIHDAVEAYVKDTPTDRITADEETAKKEREQAGLLQIRHEYAEYPSFITLIDEYEVQESPESRFVRMIDKLAPLLAHINDKGIGMRTHTDMTPTEIRTNNAHRAQQFLEEYPEQVTIIDIRSELAQLVAGVLEQG